MDLSNHRAGITTEIQTHFVTVIFIRCSSYSLSGGFNYFKKSLLEQDIAVILIHYNRKLVIARYSRVLIQSVLFLAYFLRKTFKVSLSNFWMRKSHEKIILIGVK